MNPATPSCGSSVIWSTEAAQALCVPLETPRLQIVPLNATHADAAFALMQNDALYEWISMDKPISVETLRAHWKRRERRLSGDASEMWPSWVVMSRQDGALVGEVDACIDGAMECINFGYFFFPPYWGRGFATEAVNATVAHLLLHGVTRLVATVTVGNIASAKVLQKAGFSFTRVIADNDTLRGQLVDDEEYVFSAPSSATVRP